MHIWSGISFLLFAGKVGGFTNPRLSLGHTSSLSICRQPQTKLRVLLDPPQHQMANSPENEVLPEYTCLQPGSPLRIRIGDPSASRKAWKKTRRSKSPILVPCSILGMDKIRSIDCNLRYLVQKYGKNLDEVSSESTETAPFAGIALKVRDVVRLWEREFGSSLVDHAEELGHDGIGSLLLSLYNSNNESSSGTNKGSNAAIKNQVYILKTDSNLILYIPAISVRRGRISASASSLIQMVPSDSSKNEIQHTGFVRKKSDEGNWDLQQLGAALRVNSNNALSHIQGDEVVSAYVFHYDPNGDNGSPLLVATLDPPKSNFMNGRSNNKKMEIRKNKMKVSSDKVKTMLSDLNVGDGPMKAKVIKISSHSNAAFVDLGVGRKRGKSRGGGVEKILGMLRFEDMMSAEEAKLKEGEEIVEDISDLYEVGDDGATLYTVDPESGEKTIVGSIDDEDDVNDDDDMEDDENDLFINMSAEERLVAISDILGDEESSSPVVHIGDELDVFVSNIFPQSRRFMVSVAKPQMDTNNRAKKGQKVAQKRLSKLAEGDTLSIIEGLVGTECYGIVKAVSKTGDWYYVAPDIDEGEHLPQVGVAHPAADFDHDAPQITAGTKVKVRLEGLDEKRGQLSMSLLGTMED